VRVFYDRPHRSRSDPVWLGCIREHAWSTKAPANGSIATNNTDGVHRERATALIRSGAVSAVADQEKIANVLLAGLRICTRCGLATVIRIRDARVRVSSRNAGMTETVASQQNRAALPGRSAWS
jgi:hypothetical protein